MNIKQINIDKEQLKQFSKTGTFYKYILNELTKDSTNYLYLIESKSKGVFTCLFTDRLPFLHKEFIKKYNLNPKYKYFSIHKITYSSNYFYTVQMELIHDN